MAGDTRDGAEHRGEAGDVRAPFRRAGTRGVRSSAEAAKAELRKVAEEEDAAPPPRRRKLRRMEASSGVTSKGRAAVKLAPVSTATPQQANIIERTRVHSRLPRARRRGLRGCRGGGGWRKRQRRGADKETEALKTRLREAIREKHDVAVRAREATERVAVLARALRAAGVAVP